MKVTLTIETDENIPSDCGVQQLLLNAVNEYQNFATSTTCTVYKSCKGDLTYITPDGMFNASWGIEVLD